MEESNREEHAVEDGILRTEYMFEDGYLCGINLIVKSKEDIGQVYLGDKVQLSRWLSSVNMALLAHISNPPTETISVGVESQEEVVDGMICKGCGAGLTKKKCCGGSGEVLRCARCGTTYRIVKGKKDRMRRVPPPSPLTSEVAE